MSAEEWELSPYVVARCPRCGNETPHSQLAWASQDIEDFDPEHGPFSFTEYWHFTQCVTCYGASVFAGTEDDDLSAASLVWPSNSTSPSSAPQPKQELQHLGSAASLLAARGKDRSAALLLECVDISYRFEDIGFRAEDTVDLVMAVLHVPAGYVDRFDAEVCDEIKDALTEASFADGKIVRNVATVVAAEDGDWRERVERALGLTESNTAALFPPNVRRYTADGLTFGSAEEIIVWEILKKKQAELPRNETIGIVPNCVFRAANASKFSPDFIVTYKGRAGTIGVDGPHHRGRYAADKQKDELACDAGVAYAYRIPVEDVNVPDDLTAHVERFLKRLTER